jgi:hypothetical protein
MNKILTHFNLNNNAGHNFSETPGVYVYTSDGGHIVILNQKTNMAYWYNGDTTSYKDVAKWINDYQKGRLEPAGKFEYIFSILYRDESRKNANSTTKAWTTTKRKQKIISYYSITFNKYSFS